MYILFISLNTKAAGKANPISTTIVAQQGLHLKGKVTQLTSLLVLCALKPHNYGIFILCTHLLRAIVSTEVCNSTDSFIY